MFSTVSEHSIEPQLSKCLKFEAVREIKLIKWFEFKQRDITRPMHVFLFTKWRNHNHLID